MFNRCFTHWSGRLCSGATLLMSEVKPLICLFALKKNGSRKISTMNGAFRSKHCNSQIMTWQHECFEVLVASRSSFWQGSRQHKFVYFRQLPNQLSTFMYVSSNWPYFVIFLTKIFSTGCLPTIRVKILGRSYCLQICTY